MQRKTNLFYTNTQDSNFLTFSNFTEALTGNFLSTDWKVYPSRFMCISMPALLENEWKELFIKNYLAGYYENKLAFLRDYYTKEMSGNQTSTYDIEANINSLTWLIKTIDKFKETNGYNNGELIPSFDYKITFIGDVTEFDYKGSYTDIICIIDSSDGYKNGKIQNYEITVTDGDNVFPYNENKEYLYGWTENELSNEYKQVNPKFDIENETETKYIYQNGELTSIDTDDTSIKFNIIIPLFDIMDIDYRTNFDDTGKIEEDGIVYTADMMIYDHILENTKEGRSVNNPLGIWFCDKEIELEKDPNSNYAPSWSLVISSQFKPFPYSSEYKNNDITQKDNQQAFATYAKILSQQASILTNITTLNARIQKLETDIAKFDNLTNNETLQQVLELSNLTNELNSKLNNLDNIIDEKVAAKVNELKLKWK